MEVTYDNRFEEQRERYRFCFTCEHCAHFDADTDVCLHGFPNEMHRLAYYTATPSPPTILFCKDFDLR
jgi:hypothetical protein